MTSRQWRLCVGLAIVLAGLVSTTTNVVQAASLANFVSSDFCGALVIHPQRIEKSTLAENLKTGMPKQAAADPTAALAAMGKMQGLPPGMDLAKLVKLLNGKVVTRIVILLDPMPAPTVPIAPGLIVQFGEDIDTEAVLAAITSDWQSGETQGLKYKKMKNPQPGQPDFAVYAPDTRMLVAGLEGTVVKMLAKHEGARPLLRQLQHSSFDNDILIEFLAAPVIEAKTKNVGNSKGNPLSGPDLDKALKEVKSFSIKINFSGTTLIHAEMVTDSDDTASMYASFARKGISDFKPQFEAMKKQPLPGLPAEAMPVLSKLGDEILGGLSVKNEGPQITAELPMPASLPDALKVLAQIGAKMAAQMAPPPGAH
jgi:hypothetical protein